MSGLYDAYLESVNIDKVNERKTAVRENVEMSEYEKAVALKEATEANARAKRMAYPNFVSKVKHNLLEGALWDIYGEILDKNGATDFGKNIGRGVLESYIKENGVDPIVRSFAGKTLLLSEINRNFNNTLNSILEDADKDDPDTHVIDPEKEQEYYDNLSNADSIDDITNTIRMRVVDAEERMATDNIQDKLDMDEIMGGANDRIESIRNSNSNGEMDDDTAEEAQQEAATMAKVKAAKVTGTRPRTVLEQLVRSTSEFVVADEDLAKVYTENGVIDFDKVLEASKAVYTFMEMTAALGIEDYNEDDIRSLVTK